ncbi:MAG: hypothetical protein HYV13_01810 [Candidatus Doudnabacteria bacterium]|nr:hypothetical protein [Candidatus Doudnabacteria bacterium]
MTVFLIKFSVTVGNWGDCLNVINSNIHITQGDFAMLHEIANIKTLVLTVEQIRAMAKDDPLGLSGAFAPHTDPHLDEQWAIFQGTFFGGELMPKEGKVVCVRDPHNTTSAELYSLGLTPIGIGGTDNPYDEHGRMDEQGEQINTCAAELLGKGYYPKAPRPPKEKETEENKAKWNAYRAKFERYKAEHTAYLTDPSKRGLDLLHRGEFFKRLGYEPDVIRFAIDSVTHYVKKGDRGRVNDSDAMGPVVKHKWAIADRIAAGEKFPPHLALSEQSLPQDPEERGNFLATQVVQSTLLELWIKLMNEVTFAQCLKRFAPNRGELRKVKVAGIKPSIRFVVIRKEHPLSGDGELARILRSRYVGADVILIRNSRGHVYISIREGIKKKEQEDEMTQDPDAQQESHREEQDVEIPFIEIELSLRRILIELRRWEFALRGDKTERTDAELAANYVEGSQFSMPSAKAGYILGGGSTQSHKEGPPCALDDQTIIEVIEKYLDGKIVKRSDERNGSAWADTGKEGRQVPELPPAMDQVPVSRVV